MTQSVAWPVLVDMALVREREKKVLETLYKEFDWLAEHLRGGDAAKAVEEQERVRPRIIEIVHADPVIESMPVPARNMHQTILMQSVLDEVFGFGPLGPVLRDPTVCDIWVNGPDAVFVERDNRFEKAGVHFENVDHLLLTIAKVLKPMGYELSDANPAVQAMLPNGSLVIAALPPKGASQNGPVLIIRAALK